MQLAAWWNDGAVMAHAGFPNGLVSQLALIDYMRELGIKRLTAGTAINNTPSVALLKSLGFELIETETVSFYKDADGNDIIFDGGLFELVL